MEDFLAAKNALFASLTEIDDLLDEVGVRLQREGEDLEIKLKAKQVRGAGSGERGAGRPSGRAAGGGRWPSCRFLYK